MTDDRPEPENGVEADYERPAVFWLGATRASDLGDAAVVAREELAEALDAGRWPDVLRVLRSSRELVNAPRLGALSRFTPLHHAAYHGAPEPVVRELVELGAWRTLTTAEGERAVDLARRTQRSTSVLVLLEPVVRAEIAAPALTGLSQQLHTLMLLLASTELQECAFRLPALSPLTELPEGQRFWCPVPGMYGGFEYWLRRAGLDPRLRVDTWCRIPRGANRSHLVTITGYRLLETGAVR